METIIEINNLQKSFKELKAVNNLSFKVRKGELFAFLGVNGAGKSTTISIMCGQLKKDSGNVIINGYDIDADMNIIKNDLGVVFQNSILDKSLTVVDNLRYKASLYNIDEEKFKNRIEDLNELLELKELLYRPIGKLSGGQKRRVDIARALLHKPKILILDEPTTGLDPQTRKNIWDVIDFLRKSEGITVFLTTHYMEEAATADYIVVLDSGKIIAEGTPNELKNKYVKDFIYLYNVKEEVVKKLNLPYKKIQEGYKIEVDCTNFATKLIIQNEEIFVDYEIIKGKMDDVFLAVTGKQLNNGDNK